MKLRFQQVATPKFKIKKLNITGKLVFLFSSFAFFSFTSFLGFRLITYDIDNSILGTFIISIQYWFLLFLIIFLSISNFKNLYIFFVILILIIIQGLEGYGRWRVLTSLIFLLTSLFLIKGLSMPKIKVKYLIGAFLFFLIISNLKYIGLLYFRKDINGVELPGISDMASSTPFFLLFADFFIVDHQSALVYAFDNSNHVNLYGKTYLSNLEIFLPRYLFPNKNAVNGYLNDLPINSELFKINGNIATLIGESYANFNLFAPLVFLLLGILVTIVYKRAYNDIRNKTLSIKYFIYISLYLSFFQILRDGSSSFITFTLMSFFPLLFSRFLFKKQLLENKVH
jgi:hypothetical protein